METMSTLFIVIGLHVCGLSFALGFIFLILIGLVLIGCGIGIGFTYKEGYENRILPQL